MTGKEARIKPQAMSRYPKDHKKKTHEKLVQIAAKMFREEGFRAVGVDNVMKTAGMTSGGFLAHFKNKDALFAEALSWATDQGIQNLTTGLENLEEWERFERMLKRYLSLNHRNNLSETCPFPTLAPDLPRLSSKKARQSAIADLERYVAVLTENLPSEVSERQDRAWATLALLIGSLNLARAVEDEKLAKRILEAARKMVAPEIFDKKK